jgi:hypothetical protein
VRHLDHGHNRLAATLARRTMDTESEAHQGSGDWVSRHPATETKQAKDGKPSQPGREPRPNRIREEKGQTQAEDN